MMEKAVAAIAQRSTSRWSLFDRATSGRTIGMMETLDRLGYITTGLSFLVISMVVFVHAWYAFVISGVAGGSRSPCAGA
ncbi:MAG: hypothetical protein HY038_12310 [Nitrospirae bacterium]|nr:hypothetical protein [Nitrospirota bacterium]